MADHFFDTSATAKHYRLELGTARVDALLAQAGTNQIVSALGVVELQSALARLVRMGTIRAADFQMARGRFLADIAGGLWRVVPVTGVDFQLAQQLLARHALNLNLRTLD